MIVVSDTSCITNLIAIGRAHLLADVFGRVIIPSAVRDELLVEHEDLPAFIEVQTVKDAAAVFAILSDEIDLGEAEAVILAEELNADVLLIDESAGRALAAQRGLRIVGVLGVFREAKARGFVSEIRPDVDALQARGFWISPALRERVLRDLGEA